MTLCSEEVLRKLNKNGLIGIALSLQSTMESSSTKVLEELTNETNLKQTLLLQEMQCRCFRLG